MHGMFNSTKLINSNITLTCLCCEPRRHALLAFCASSTNGNRILLPMLRPRTIKTCWTAVTFDSRAVPVLDYPLITEPGYSKEHKPPIKQYLTSSVTKTSQQSQKSWPPGTTARHKIFLNRSGGLETQNGLGGHLHQIKWCIICRYKQKGTFLI